MKVETSAGLVSRLVEEVHDVSSEAILEAASFFEVEGAGGINLDPRVFAQDGAQVALKVERSLPHLRHRISNNPV